MTPWGFALLVSGAIALWLLRSRARARPTAHSTTQARALGTTTPNAWRPPRWPFVLAVTLGVVVALLASSAALGLAAGVITAVSAMCLATSPLSKRKVAAAEAIARFASIVANQATVSRTVTEAISRAAPLIDGPVGQAADTLVRECRTIGINAAAQRFPQRANTPAAGWLAEVIASAATSGGQWASAMTVLEAEAAEAAATARHFHRHISVALTQVAVATLMGVAIVVGSARINATAWDWFLHGGGATVGLAATAVVALLTWKLLFGAWELLR